MRSDHPNRTGLSANRAKTSARVRAALGGLGGLALLCVPALAQTPAFELIEPSVGFAKTQVYDIADDGTIVAMSYNGSAPSNSPIIRYSPGGVRDEFPLGRAPRISGDGLVVGYLPESNGFSPTLFYPDGSQHLVPGVVYQGQSRLGTITYMNRDGSVAMLSTSASNGASERTAFRWTSEGDATSLPPFPGGSTWNSTTGLSSDGRIAVGNWAPSSASTDRPWVWGDGAPSLTPFALPDGTTANLGVISTLTGDGRTMFFRHDVAPGNLYTITDGVANLYSIESPLGGQLYLPTDASFDGSVLVGELSGGSWIWTQATGAMRAEDFLSMHGVNIAAPYGISRLMVSNDGLHFAGLASAAGVDAMGFVATIPSPGIVSSLILVGIGATARRRRWRRNAASTRRSGFCFAALAGTALLGCPALAQTPAFELIEPSAGYTATWVSDIADNGTVVGWSFTGTVPGFGQTYRYAPGGARTEYGIGDFPRISGDGHVVSVDSVGSNFDVVLYRDDGTQHTIPPVIINGQSRRGRMTHLNRDGSIAMLYYRSTGNEFESFRWTLDGNTATLPPFPGGSTFNSVTGLSSDGRIAVGNWAPNFTQTDRPWVWEDGGPAIIPFTLPDGTSANLGVISTLTGDGRTMFFRHDVAPGNLYTITDGVANLYSIESPLGGQLYLPTDASFDGSVLVGELSGGSWIWTQATGAMRAEDFLSMHGVSIIAPYQISRLMVSNDGLHFAGLASAAGVDARGFVATIPSPGIVSSLILVGIGATAIRRRR
ncbi:MAG: hypothetical protein IPK69_01780 [Phycisphaerales bacterium]|nr:MAG: hypothetical protein IPK69_01780 [Phycisphaerales bacterium]